MKNLCTFITLAYMLTGFLLSILEFWAVNDYLTKILMWPWIISIIISGCLAGRPYLIGQCAGIYAALQAWHSPIWLAIGVFIGPGIGFMLITMVINAIEATDKDKLVNN